MSDSGCLDGPWSTGFDWGTVEADPDLSAALQARTDQRDQARRFAVALEQRLDEIRRVVAECPESRLREVLSRWLSADLAGQ